MSILDGKHRGFAFVTYSSSADAQDAIDNMDLNELRGRVVKVNLARPMKGPLQPEGNRASTHIHHSQLLSLF
jgi:peptidyl-prolyl isomerase E (cyclophilin E)